MDHLDDEVIRLRSLPTKSSEIIRILGISRSSYARIVKRLIASGKSRPVPKRHNSLKHGMHRDRLYRIWSGMKQRCTNEKNLHYKNYGGRGISVCNEWAGSFECFREWAMASGYKEPLTIDRKNGDGDYEPGNCRWASRHQQQSNRRKTVGGSSGFVGVTRSGGAWVAQVMHQRKYHYGGRFSSEEEAAKARDVLATRLHGEFAVLNFPEYALTRRTP